MKITRIGHACVLLEGSSTILVDPFIKDNPSAALSADQLPKIDYMIVTHDHFDHFGSDVIELAQRDGATLVAIFEVTAREDVAGAGLKTIGMNIGGTFKAANLSISLTPAVHSAAHGSPAGVVIAMDGKRVYHAGDTALFSDMSLIPQQFGVLDVALLPIGGHFTMDVDAAAMAVKQLKPKVTIPIHYNTWPAIKADPQAFAEQCSSTTKVVIVEPGGSYEIGN